MSASPRFLVIKRSSGDILHETDNADVVGRLVAREPERYFAFDRRDQVEVAGPQAAPGNGHRSSGSLRTGAADRDRGVSTTARADGDATTLSPICPPGAASEPAAFVVPEGHIVCLGCNDNTPIDQPFCVSCGRPPLEEPDLCRYCRSNSPASDMPIPCCSDCAENDSEAMADLAESFALEGAGL